MRSSPLKRGKPLQRKTRLRPRGKTKYRRRERDLPYMKTVKRLPCIVRTFIRLPEDDLDLISNPLMVAWVTVRRQHTSCRGPVQADHMGERALGQKAPDDTTVPSCMRHHGERTDYSHTFGGFTKLEMRAFCDWAVEHTRAQVSDLRAKVNHG